MGDITVKTKMGDKIAQAMIIHCFDPRFQGPFAEFARVASNGKEVAPVSLPGGVWWLAHLDSLTEGRVRRLMLGDMKRFRSSVRDFVSKRGVASAILVNHQGCRWYADRNPRLSASDLIRLQGQDLMRAAGEIHDWLGDSFLVSGYLATYDREGQVTFSQIV